MVLVKGLVFQNWSLAAGTESVNQSWGRQESCVGSEAAPKTIFCVIKLNVFFSPKVGTIYMQIPNYMVN